MILASSPRSSQIILHHGQFINSIPSNSHIPIGNIQLGQFVILRYFLNIVLKSNSILLNNVRFEFTQDILSMQNRQLKQR